MQKRLPCICSHSSWIKSKQGANQLSIITKANIQKALSVSALLRHPLPLQPPSLALVLPPSLHPTPPFLSATLSPPSLSCYRSPRCISSISLFLPLFASLSFCHPVFTPYSLALALSLLLLHEHLPLPPTHTHSQFLFLSFFLKTNLLLMCVYIPPSHSFNSVSLTSLRGSKLEAIATHTFPLQLSAWHQIYIHNEQAQHFSCCLAHGLHVNQRAGFFSKWTFVPVLWYLYTHWSKSTSQLIWNIMLSFVSIIKGFIFSQRKGAEEIPTSLMSGQHLWSTSWLWGETTCLTLPKNMSKAH